MIDNRSTVHRSVKRRLSDIGMDAVAHIEGQTVNIVFNMEHYSELRLRTLTRCFLTMCTCRMTEEADFLVTFPADALELLDVALGLTSLDYLQRLA